MRLDKLILHRGDDAVVGRKWQRWEKSVEWAEENLGVLGLGLGYLVKDNEFDIKRAERHLRAGIGGIEFDVQDVDGTPVISHPRIVHAVRGHGGRGNGDATDLKEVAHRLGEYGAEYFVHLKTKDSRALQKTVEIFERAELLQNVFFQTYYVSHLRQIKGKFAYMGWPTNEAMEILQRLENRRSRLDIPAVLARSKPMLDYLRQKYPEVDLHVNLTHDRKLIAAVASGTLAVDSVMVANYDW